jgi:hypothetical protein
VGCIEKVTLNGVTSWRHYIAGGSGATAIYIRRSNGTSETDYLLKDHLGSLDMITRSDGTQMTRLSPMRGVVVAMAVRRPVIPQGPSRDGDHESALMCFLSRLCLFRYLLA